MYIHIIQLYECVVRLARRTAVTRFKDQVGSNPATLTNKCSFSYIQLYLYMSGYDCSSFGQLYDSIRFARYNIYNIRYSLLGMDDKVY